VREGQRSPVLVNPTPRRDVPLALKNDFSPWKDFELELGSASVVEGIVVRLPSHAGPGVVVDSIDLNGFDFGADAIVRVSGDASVRPLGVGKHDRGHGSAAVSGICGEAALSADNCHG
jgi:hypothetical protein